MYRHDRRKCTVGCYFEITKLKKTTWPSLFVVAFIETGNFLFAAFIANKFSL